MGLAHLSSALLFAPPKCNPHDSARSTPHGWLETEILHHSVGSLVLPHSLGTASSNPTSRHAPPVSSVVVPVESTYHTVTNNLHTLLAPLRECTAVNMGLGYRLLRKVVRNDAMKVSCCSFLSLKAAI